MEVGFNGGQPIDMKFFMERISGRSNPIIAKNLFPDWTEEQHRVFYTDKEERYRKLALAGGIHEMPVCVTGPGCVDMHMTEFTPYFDHEFTNSTMLLFYIIKQGLTKFLDWQDAQGIRRVAVTNAPKENVEVRM